MRIGILAPVRFPIAEPYEGGLETQTALLAEGLQARGHDVVLFAAPGSRLAADVGVEVLALSPAILSATARADVSMTAEWWMQEHHAYLSALTAVIEGRVHVDLVHNNSLHYLPVAMAAALPVPMLTALHTPPTPWIESAVQAGGDPGSRFVAVSEASARAWAHVIPDAGVVRNGVDTSRWSPGPGGPGAVWAGRLVPEKGAHLAVQAARLAGVGLTLAGPILDADWFHREVAPLLGGDVRYVGHLGTDALVTLVGSSGASLVTPCWDEPYGLVVGESLAAGTPVAGFARGALPELIAGHVGCLVPEGDVAALAVALHSATRLARTDCRAHAIAHCSVDAMLDGYEQEYELATSPVRRVA